MRYAHLSSDHLKEYTDNASLKKCGGVVVLKEKKQLLPKKVTNLLQAIKKA